MQVPVPVVIRLVATFGPNNFDLRLKFPILVLTNIRTPLGATLLIGVRTALVGSIVS